MRSITDTRLDRLGRELGELVEEHASGLAPGARRCARYRDDPVGFDRWGGREPEDFQEAIMNAVHAQRYTTVRGGNGTGKDWLLGSLAIWAAFARQMLVLVISATERQAVNQSMMEVFTAWRAHQHAGHRLCGQFFRGSLRIDGADRIIALTGGASVDALTGWHDPAGVLVLVSESQAEALEGSVYETFDAVTTNAGSRVVVMGNPTRPFGPFYDIHQRKSWQRFAVSVLDTPNLKAGRIVHPAFPAPGWPAAMEVEHGGVASPWYVSRVLGQFPTSAEDALIRRELLDDAAEETRVEEFTAEVSGGGPRHADWRGHSIPATHAILGVDVAREGEDQSAVVVRRGPVIWELHRWRETDTIDNSRRIVGVVRRLIGEGVGVSHVVVDEIAVGGGVHDELRRQLEDVYWLEPCVGIRNSDLSVCRPKLVGFKSSRRAPMPERFSDTRAQSFWQVRDAFERGRVAFHSQLDPELLGALREELPAHSYRHEGDDRIRVGPKDEVRRRLGRSPDLADALAMSYEPVLEKTGRKRVQWA